jgi:hypothetical protein
MLLSFEICFHRRFIEVICFPFYDRQGAGWTFTQAGSQPVTVSFCHNTCLAIPDLYCTLGTGGHAQTAAITKFIIDVYDFSSDLHVLLLGLISWHDPPALSASAFRLPPAQE